MQGLPYLAGTSSDQETHASSISANGSVIAGGQGVDMATVAVRWTLTDGARRLGYIPGNPNSLTIANAVSADGSTIVGQTVDRGTGFRWTAAGGMQSLGIVPFGFDPDLPTQVFDVTTVSAVSGDGSIIVGYVTNDGGGPTEAYAFDATHGLRNLRALLVNDCGLNLDGWDLVSPMGISADGLTIAGAGTHLGQDELWIAVIPEPAALPLLGLVAGEMLRRRRRHVKRPEEQTTPVMASPPIRLACSHVLLTEGKII
jgi:uncharacterized membrane protein